MYICISILALDFKIKTFIIKANNGTDSSNPNPSRKDFERKKPICTQLQITSHWQSCTQEGPMTWVALSFRVLWLAGFHPYSGAYPLQAFFFFLIVVIFGSDCTSLCNTEVPHPRSPGLFQGVWWCREWSASLGWTWGWGLQWLVQVAGAALETKHTTTGPIILVGNR